MGPPVCVTGPVANTLPDKLLLGAKKPPWVSEWIVSADYINTELLNGAIPYTNIAALFFKVIMFYSRDNSAAPATTWSSAYEVCALLKEQFMDAVSPDNEDMAAELGRYLSSFDVLLTKFCFPEPTEAIVWVPAQQELDGGDADSDMLPVSSQPTGDFGSRLPEKCAVAQFQLGPDIEDPRSLITTEALKTAGFSQESITALLPDTPTPAIPSGNNLNAAPAVDAYSFL